MNDDLWTNEQVSAMFECNEEQCEAHIFKVSCNTNTGTKRTLITAKPIITKKTSHKEEEEFLNRKRLERSQFFKRPSCNYAHA